MRESPRLTFIFLALQVKQPLRVRLWTPGFFLRAGAMAKPFDGRASTHKSLYPWETRKGHFSASIRRCLNLLLANSETW